MKKKLCLILLIVMLVLSIFAVVASADEIPTSGSCGKNGNDVVWNYHESTKTLTIIGEGAMIDYDSSDNVPWKNIKDDIKTVVIREGVTGIGAYSFADCSSLKEVIISDKVSVMENYALLLDKTAYRDSLTGVYKTDSIKLFTQDGSVRTFSFEDDDARDKFEVLSFGRGEPLKYALNKNGEIRYVSAVTNAVKNMPVKVKNYKYIVFDGIAHAIASNAVLFNLKDDYEAELLRHAEVLSGTDEITYGAVEDTKYFVIALNKDNRIEFMAGTKLYSSGDSTDTDIDDNVTNLAFEGSRNLNNIKDSCGLTHIGYAAFSGCSTLTDITIPNGVTHINSAAFSCCSSLTNITIPDSVTDIADYAFAGCTGLTDVIIPDGITAIQDYTFWNCGNLATVTIPKSVVNIGGSAFAGCDNLKTVNYDGTDDEWKAISIAADNEPLLRAKGNGSEAIIKQPQTFNQSFVQTVTKTMGASPFSKVATLIQGNGAITYSSSNTKVAIVDANTGEVNIKSAGTVVIKATAAETEEYNQATIMYTLTVKPAQIQPPSGGGGGSVSAPTTNTISVPSKVVGGTVSVSPAKAAKGDNIIITAKAEDGKKLDKLTVSVGGKEVALKDLGDGKYSFIMPDGKVSVDAVFSDVQNTVVSFKDVAKDSYYYDAVQWAVANGITQGTTADTFNPDAACTRAQMVTFLWRAAGSPEPQGTNNNFADVSGNSYYIKAVQWAVEKGITKGADSNTFSPDEVVNRSQVVTFLWRAAGSPVVTSDAVFNDVPSGVYYSDAVSWAVGKKITTGTTASSFAPVADCSRAEIATFMYRNQ